MKINSKYNKLRNIYKEFNYDKYSYVLNDNILEISFEFTNYDGIKFNPKFKVPVNEKIYLNKDKKVLDEIIFNMGLVELISYWKATCSPIVNVKCSSLTKKQKQWWKKLYFNGLGEFFYTNNIVTNENEFMEIVCDEKRKKEKFVFNENLKGCLIPIGGGKDSIVTVESLKNENNMCYIINPRGATIGTVKIANYLENTVFVNRSIDNNLLKLNEKGFFNGHTPFSAIVAFSSYLVAYLYNKKYIALSNESSANESNVKGTNINHQYSKSIEFENDFREYIKENISDEIQYFSFLRPLNEFEIVKKFCKYPKYFKIFKSCNVGSKENKWCNNCPKCLYVYIMLSAFLPSKEITNIFGTDMFKNINLKVILDGLVSDEFDKPFECVGTKEEINYALYIKIKKLKEDKEEIPELLLYYIDNYIDIYNYNYNKKNNVKEKVEEFYDFKNNIPSEYKELI